MNASMLLLLSSALLLLNSMLVVAFVPRLAFTRNLNPSPSITQSVQQRTRFRPLSSAPDYSTSLGDDDDDDDDEIVDIDEIDDDDEDDDDDDEEDDDPYTKLASSEFQDPNDPSSSSALSTIQVNTGMDATMTDWGGALGKLRQRVEDVESGKSQDPSHALFRMMSSETPNHMIGQFVSSANPQTVQAMSGAVGSLLGGLSNPNMGVETLVKASGEKIGNLCFQLQMTGYMFRNAEYVLALKDLMNIQGTASLQDYKKAFDRIDRDGSGYIESKEIQTLFDNVYDSNNNDYEDDDNNNHTQAPQFEIDAFLQFFDENNDGRISWVEFESGLGDAMKTQMEKKNSAARLLGAKDDFDDDDDEDDEEEDEFMDVDANVSGTIEIEMEDGKKVEMEAKEYIQSLKQEARALKEALRRENLEDMSSPDARNGGGRDGGGGMDIVKYIASRQGDVKSLTEGISPEIVETMRRLVNFVLEGGDKSKSKNSGNKVKDKLTDEQKGQMEMEIPGSALEQLALWQLVLGYRLREAEVTGDYMKLLE